MDMQRDLHFSNTVYGTGAGIFLGSALFDLPSTILPASVARRSPIMISWACSHRHDVHTPDSFYVLRCWRPVRPVLPRHDIYLTYWFPTHERARAVARFMIATSLAGVVGGPLSATCSIRRPPRLAVGSGFSFRRPPHHPLGISVLFLLKDTKAEWMSPKNAPGSTASRAGPPALRRPAHHHPAISASRALSSPPSTCQPGRRLHRQPRMPLILASFPTAPATPA
jgi:hypothetical protein